VNYSVYWFISSFSNTNLFAFENGPTPSNNLRIKKSLYAYIPIMFEINGIARCTKPERKPVIW
jgi:hypothetical protein